MPRGRRRRGTPAPARPAGSRASPRAPRPAYQQHEPGEEQQVQAEVVPQIVEVEPGRDDEEEAGDQQHLQRLVELGHPLDRHPALVGQGQPHDGDRQQPRLLLQVVGEREGDEDGAEHGRLLEVVGHEEPAHHRPHQGGAGQAQQGARQADPGERAEDRGHRLPGLLGLHDLEDEQGEHGAERVDEDALGLQDRAQPPGAHVAEQRADDRRAGHDEDGAEQPVPGPAGRAPRPPAPWPARRRRRPRP